MGHRGVPIMLYAEVPPKPQNYLQSGALSWGREQGSKRAVPNWAYTMMGWDSSPSTLLRGGEEGAVPLQHITRPLPACLRFCRLILHFHLLCSHKLLHIYM